MDFAFSLELEARTRSSFFFTEAQKKGSEIKSVLPAAVSVVVFLLLSDEKGGGFGLQIAIYRFLRVEPLPPSTINIAARSVSLLLQGHSPSSSLPPRDKSVLCVR